MLKLTPLTLVSTSNIKKESNQLVSKKNHKQKKEE